MYNIKYHEGELSEYSFLVTGGAGFIGSNIVEYLLKYGAKKVRVLDNFSTGSIENLKAFMDNSALEVIEGDIRDLETCRQAVAEIDYVTHQAALGSVPRSIHNPIMTNEVNVNGFLNMLVAAKDEKVKRFVYAASSSTYGDHPALPKVEEIIGNPLSPYAVTKYVNELYAGVFSKVYGFHTIGLRYFNVFGPRQNPNGSYAAVIPLFIKSASNRESCIINGDGQTSRDFTFVENAVQANIKSLGKENLSNSVVLNIAKGENTSLNNLWNVITNQLNLAIKPTYRTERQGDVKHSLANVNKAKGVIGYNPIFNLNDGILITIKWFNSVYADFEERAS